MNEITFKPIGIIYSPFKTIENIPIQNIGAKGVKGTIEIFKEFVTGLKDLDGFSHLILIYHLHKVIHDSLLVKPFLDTVEHGIFATRSPVRPNPIGLTVVKLIEIKNNLITIENLDILYETPLLDIKPFLPMIDDTKDIRIGWLTGKIEQFEIKKSDNRFIN
ncbi:MAG: tRNA (N6-threonylcarbamoyladenosine(37)-N6)-methyltransferase TrmO [Bacteroidetes bacterium CG02_land_8_20_14_3_00_31_25]|nr:tRNA (N6-threonylcarbamoyladenosine(37)-N6)-methyltransferase TrmO [Bacteroidota bacterium]PIV60345.1 MAG: tRNA (N6-threonylcarbamoyladenosine(37)-N6)-methyltransferase TrmO [Bacteroidetes bacterium CG02_land_8_20_14_3_00_31_25]PIX32964.1 MAG: tRNA (N6-threonylcarbamoyladenosine(37)-N6)-methyltransferase TrmO [Bacteroidetes bacterium CG_4_8_14_3_um_filter_31_14]PIY03460.1 MAG: tRNA (N6-threonylcarbamoyladenosine(37)-N6)-methyltransferase TrmO [Bacteroidetes bacterium CG_4_10_14_3_um_filter_31